MKVMITGAAGFIGGFLAKHCLEAGCSVLGLGCQSNPRLRGMARPSNSAIFGTLLACVAPRIDFPAGPYLSSGSSELPDRLA